MTAVRVEPCFVTNPTEEKLLRDGTLIRPIAAAIVRGIERFFGARPATVHGTTPPEGQARLPG